MKCIDAIVKTDKQWSLIKERYDNYITAARSSYQKQEPLIKYFEAAAINVALSQGPSQATRCITADYQLFISTYDRLVAIMKQVEDINSEGLIDKIDDIDK